MLVDIRSNKVEISGSVQAENKYINKIKKNV